MLGNTKKYFPIRRVPDQAGMTLIELIIACAILLILASAALPIAKFTVIRSK
jgi:prepilin-type N-terminal cleavage/methylation domain-containing protein